MKRINETKQIKRVRLENTTENHFKEYEIEIMRYGTEYEVKASWGRIGATPQSQTKYSGYSEDEAYATLWDLYNQKTKKGYKEC